eukprot:763979-Hanusia_phi.AAC.3
MQEQCVTSEQQEEIERMILRWSCDDVEKASALYTQHGIGSMEDLRAEAKRLEEEEESSASEIQLFGKEEAVQIMAHESFLGAKLAVDLKYTSVCASCSSPAQTLSSQCPMYIQSALPREPGKADAAGKSVSAGQAHDEG